MIILSYFEFYAVTVVVVFLTISRMAFRLCISEGVFDVEDKKERILLFTSFALTVVVHSIFWPIFETIGITTSIFKFLFKKILNFLGFEIKTEFTVSKEEGETK